MAAAPGQSVVAITGAAGALGRHLTRHLLDAGVQEIRALVHRTPLPEDLATTVVSCPGNLLEPHTLEAWLRPSAVVIHLAYSATMASGEQQQAIETLAAACARANVRRVVHCSTAVVAGATQDRVVNEETVCVPVTAYERSKFKIEEVFSRAAAGRFPLLIARPTAVFGPELQNLVSLSDALTRGSGSTHYLRRSLFGRRHMHLVPVATVVRALAWLASDAGATAGERDQQPDVFVISADAEPGGDFATVERRLRRALGVTGRRVPAPAIPPGVLSVALRLLGRSDRDPARVYDSAKLFDRGFGRVDSLEQSIETFAAWYRARTHRRPAAA